MTGLGLELSDVASGYGPVRILHGVDLCARPGAITALIGSNGAGKTTLLRTVAGLLPTLRGTICLSDGERVDRLSIDLRVDRGLVMVPEGRLVFAQMSVEENLKVAAFAQRARSAKAVTLEAIYVLFPRLRERRRQLAGTLSGGEQQMLALGRGLMSRPSVLLLDEPTLGLAPVVAKQIFAYVAALRRDGLTVLLAEQDVRRTLQLADFAYVLENGRIVLAGPGPSLLERPEIRSAYLGL